MQHICSKKFYDTQTQNVAYIETAPLTNIKKEHYVLSFILYVLNPLLN